MQNCLNMKIENWGYECFEKSVFAGSREDLEDHVVKHFVTKFIHFTAWTHIISLGTVTKVKFQSFENAVVISENRKYFQKKMSLRSWMV